MAKLGKKPIPIPDKVTVSVKGQIVSVQGPQGTATQTMHAGIRARVDEKQHLVFVECDSREKFQKALHGLNRSLIANVIQGVVQGYAKELEINGVGYGAKIQGKELILTLGYSHPVHLPIPEGLAVTCPAATRVQVKGIDKQEVGQFAANVRAAREVEPYNLKGIRYVGEAVKRKAGKTFVSGT